jgi:hypothetical protein
VGYDKTALMFVERDTATLAVVETADGSVVKVLSRSLRGEDTIAALAEMVTSLEVQESAAQGLFVVGSGVDVTAVKAQLTDLVSVPVIAPEEPRLALARGAALASANAPRYDASTVGLAYSQVPDGTTVYPLALAGEATTFLGDANSSADTADIASDSDDVSERSTPFPLVGSSVAAIFVAGMMALTIAIAMGAQPTVDEGSGEMAVRPDAAAPPTAVQSAPPAAPQQPVPRTVPDPAPAAQPRAATATARLKVPPASPPPVLVRNAAPAPAAPPAPFAPAAPPPVVLAPGIPPLVIQWLPPILQPPPFFNPGPKGPRFGPGGGGHGGGRHGGHGGGD